MVIYHACAFWSVSSASGRINMLKNRTSCVQRSEIKTILDEKSNGYKYKIHFNEELEAQRNSRISSIAKQRALKIHSFLKQIFISG